LNKYESTVDQALIYCVGARDTSWLPCWNYDVKSKIHRSMHGGTILPNFILIHFCNDGALGFFWKRSPQQLEGQDE